MSEQIDAGDGDAARLTTDTFEHFVVLHAASFASIAYLITGDGISASRAVEDAWAGIFRAWPRIRTARKPLVPALAFVVDAAVRRPRRTKNADPGGLELHDDVTTQKPTAPNPDNDTDVVWQGLADLAPRDRAVVVLHWHVGLAARQVGRVLHWRTPRPGRTAELVFRDLRLTATPHLHVTGAETDPERAFTRTLRSTLKAQAASVDVDTVALLARLRLRLQGVHQKRHISPAAVAAACSVLALGWVGVVVVASTDQASTPAWPAQALSGKQLVGYGSIVVSVPASWGHNQTACGFAATDTVIYPDAERGGECTRSQVRLVHTADPSSVTFAVPASNAPLPGLHKIDRVAGSRVYATGPIERGGVLERIVAVPDADLQIVIRSADALAIEEIIGSIHAVPDGYTVVPACVGLLLRDATGLLDDAGLRVGITDASMLSQRYDQPPVTNQSIMSGEIVPTQTEVGLGFPSLKN